MRHSTTMHRSVLVLGFALFGAACTEDAPAGATKTATEADPASVRAVAKDASPDRRLALQKTTGSREADRALDAAQARAEKNPESADAMIVLGRAWIRKARETGDPGYYLNAKACAQIVKKRDPDSRLAKNLEALVLLNAHEFEAARPVSKSIVEAHPDDAMAFGSLSDAELELGLYDEASSYTQAMMDLKPNLPSYARASYLSWLRGDPKGAKEAIRAALDAGRDKHDPEPRAWVLTQAATLFFVEGDLEGATAGVDMTTDWLPGYPSALVLRGRIALLAGNGAAAKEALEKAYAQSPLVETAWLLGDACTLVGDASGAAKAYANVLSDGKKSDPRTLSFFLSTRNESPDLALALAQEEYKKRKDVLTEEALAFTHYRKGQFKEAKASMAKARRLGTQDPRAIAHEGLVRLAAGETSSAKALWKVAAANASLDRLTRAEVARALENRP